MDTIEIAIKGLEDEERGEVQQIFEGERVGVEVQQLIEKNYLEAAEQIIKIVFYNFNVWEWMRDGILWGSLTTALNKVLAFIKRKKPAAKTQLIIKYKKVTIAFPVNETDKKEMLDKLPDELKGLDPDTDKITSVSYSEENSSIEIRQL